MKTPIQMTIDELSEALPSMSDDEIRAGYAAETGTKGHKERSGATDLYEEAAETRGISLTEKTITDASEDGKADPIADLAREVVSIGERLTELEASLEKVMPYLEGAANGEPVQVEIKDGPALPTREEVLQLHRRVESIANHLNFRLPS